MAGYSDKKEAVGNRLRRSRADRRRHLPWPRSGACDPAELTNVSSPVNRCAEDSSGVRAAARSYGTTEPVELNWLEQTGSLRTDPAGHGVGRRARPRMCGATSFAAAVG
jgi:hypothetical protein